MSFNPQGYPFTALPTNLRGKIQPNQLAVLWVIQSYASKDDQECYPSLNTIAKSACMSKRTAQKIVNQLVSLGLLERKHQHGKNGEQGSNLYKVTIWHLANVPEPSIHRRGKSCTPAKSAMTPTKNLHPPIANIAPKQDVYKLDTKELNKNTKKEYSEEFSLFWLTYQTINKKASGQNKPKAWAEYKKALKHRNSDYLLKALKKAKIDQNKTEQQGGFAACFPNAFRWLRDQSYEGLINEVATNKQNATLSKPSEEIPSGCPF